MRVIGLQEAKLSSEIENIITTNDELYRAFSDENARYAPQTKEVLHYNTALWHGYNRLKAGQPLATRLFEKLAEIIKQSAAGVRRGTETVIMNQRAEVIYTPPTGEAVIRDRLRELEQFLYHEDGLDPLIKMAVVHYQFEAIHPFADGNGRSGRILNILYLIEAGLLQTPVLYLSRYIIQHKSDYYSGLRRVTEEAEWENWVLFMLCAVEETARETHGRIQEIRALMQQTADKVHEEAPKIYSKDLIEILFAQPYCKIRFLEEAGIAKRQTASKYLQELEKIGVLRRMDAGREAYFLNTAFLELLSR